MKSSLKQPRFKERGVRWVFGGRWVEVGRVQARFGAGHCGAAVRSHASKSVESVGCLGAGGLRQKCGVYRLFYRLLSCIFSSDWAHITLSRCPTHHECTHCCASFFGRHPFYTFSVFSGYSYGWHALKREFDVSRAPEVSCSKLSRSSNCSALQTMPFPRSNADMRSIVCSNWCADDRARENRDC